MADGGGGAGDDSDLGREEGGVAWARVMEEQQAVKIRKDAVGGIAWCGLFKKSSSASVNRAGARWFIGGAVDMDGT
jgi:hypothetical protein